MLLRLRREWGAKPPPGTPLDPGHPLRPQLVAYVPFLTPGAAPTEHVSRAAFSAAGSGSATWIGGPRGGLSPLMPATLQWQLAGTYYSGGPFTAMAWLYRNASDAFSTFLASGDYAAGGGWGIAAGVGTGTHIGAVLSNASTSTTAPASSNTNIATNQWHHYAASYDGSSALSFYLDGRPLGTYSISFVATASTIGLWINGTKGGIGIRNVAIDNMMVFSSVLSPAQVADLYRRPWQLLASPRVAVATSAPTPTPTPTGPPTRTAGGALRWFPGLRRTPPRAAR